MFRTGCRVSVPGRSEESTQRVPVPHLPIVDVSCFKHPGCSRISSSLMRPHLSPFHVSRCQARVNADGGWDRSPRATTPTGMRRRFPVHFNASRQSKHGLKSNTGTSVTRLPRRIYCAITPVNLLITFYRRYRTPHGFSSDSGVTVPL